MCQYISISRLKSNAAYLDLAIPSSQYSPAASSPVQFRHPTGSKTRSVETFPREPKSIPGIVFGQPVGAFTSAGIVIGSSLSSLHTRKGPLKFAHSLLLSTKKAVFILYKLLIHCDTHLLYVLHYFVSFTPVFVNFCFIKFR